MQRIEDGFVVVTAPPERASEVSAALSKAEIYVTEMTSGKGIPGELLP